MTTRKTHFVTRGALLLSILAAGVAPAAAQPSFASLPPVAELKDGWNTLTPGGETSCAVDPNYRFFVRRAAADRVLVFFEGGGACADGRSCDLVARPMFDGEPTFKATAAVLPPPPGGIFDLAHPDNPFADYSMVFVSYCTGDVHLGARDTTYTTEDTGGTRQFVIKHRGQTNAMAALQWLYANFPAPRDIFVTGTSAGGYATPFYASVLARHYPRARVAGLGDAAGALRGPGAVDLNRRQEIAVRSPWGLPQALRRHAGWEGFRAVLPGSVELYATAAAAAPQLGLFQLDHAHDRQQRLRYVIHLGDPNPDVFAGLRANRRDISAAVPRFRWFTAGGPDHGIMFTSRFYSYTSEGRRLRDWVAAIAAGETVPNVECTDCSRPGLQFSDFDVQLLDRAIALISAPDAWLAQATSQPCMQQRAGPYSLTCAIQVAHLQLTGQTAPGYGLPAAFLEVIFTVAARTGNPMFTAQTPATMLRMYNNRPGTSAQDMIGLLREVRDRVVTARSRKAPPAAQRARPVPSPLVPEADASCVHPIRALRGIRGNRTTAAQQPRLFRNRSGRPPAVCGVHHPPISPDRPSPGIRVRPVASDAPRGRDYFASCGLSLSRNATPSLSHFGAGAPFR